MFKLQRAIAGLAVVCIIAAGTPAVCADAPVNPHRLELARKLFAQMQMDQMMDGMMRQMTPTMIAQARKTNPNLTDEQAKAITEAVTESASDLMKKVMDRVAPLYAETFTDKEMQDLVDFYDSPSGRAMIAKMPTMAAKMGPMMQDLAPDMVADVQRRICTKTDCTKLAAPGKPSA
jgi:hypothetical protein